MSDPAPGTPGFVERLLAARIGLDVASVGAGLIVRGVRNRMEQLGVRREEDYERILLGPTGEIQALIEEVVIPESWFFRDERPFATFRRFARAGWVEQPLRPPISVLCLPCAAGEEPYSVVIALLELGLPRHRFEVVAVDISERAIRRAAAGLYGENAFRGMDPRIRAGYFATMQGRSMLAPEVRTAVRFERGNILDDRLLADHPGFDTVFCRNLLIYFDEPARERAFANLDRLTSGDGLLFLGHADRPDPRGSGRFVATADKGSFAHRKVRAGVIAAPETAATARPPSSVRPAPSTRPPAAVPGVSPRPAPPAPPAPVVSVPTAGEPLDPSVPEATEVLATASSLADRGRYAEAARLIRERLAGAGLDARARFLLGVIHQAAGDRAAAEAELAKAVYLDPEHDEALLALALLARRKGDVAAEAAFRRRAERVVARKGRP